VGSHGHTDSSRVPVGKRHAPKRIQTGKKKQYLMKKNKNREKGKTGERRQTDLPDQVAQGLRETDGGATTAGYAKNKKKRRGV